MNSMIRYDFIGLSFSHEANLSKCCICFAPSLSKEKANHAI